MLSSNPSALGICYSLCRWNFPCVPKEILGLGGCVPKTQALIRSITLYTPPLGQRRTNDYEVIQEQNVDGLTELTHLTSLRWEGLHTQRQLRILRKCVDRNYTHMESLVLTPHEYAQFDFTQLEFLLDNVILPCLRVRLLRRHAF